MKVVSFQRLCSSLKPIHRRVPSRTKKMTGGGRYGGASGKLVRSSMKREERQGRSGIPPVNKVLCEVQRLKLLALRCSWFKFLCLVGSYAKNGCHVAALEATGFWMLADIGFLAASLLPGTIKVEEQTVKRSFSDTEKHIGCFGSH